MSERVDIEELERLIAEATSGPWWSARHEGYNIIWRLPPKGSTRAAERIARCEFPHPQGEANSELIVALVNAAPALLAEVKEARDGSKTCRCGKPLSRYCPDCQRDWQS